MSWFGHELVGLSPPWVLVLLLAAVALVLWLHLRRQRRRRTVAVSSAGLWDDLGLERALGTTTARSSRWRRPGGWLLLHLLVVVALTLAAGDPRPLAPPEQRRELILLMDTSASMAAWGAGGSSRLDEARGRALAIVRGMRRGDRALVARFDRQVRTLAGWTGDQRPLTEALQGLAAGSEENDGQAAARWLTATQRSQPRARAFVLTDDGAAIARLEKTEVLVVGQSMGNVAIRGFTLVPVPGDPDQLSAEVLVSNLGDRPVTARVRLGDARQRGTPALATSEQQLASGASGRIAFIVKAPHLAEIEARLTAPSAGVDNALTADDRAQATVPRALQRRVLVVGQRNLYLEGALLSFGREVAVETVAPALAEAGRDAWLDHDMVVFDGWTPARAPEAGRFLMLAPRGPGSPMPVGAAVLDPVPGRVERDHPLLRQLSLSDLNIKRAWRLGIEPSDQVPAAAGDLPLLVARARGPLRMVVTSFDPRQSDLPLRPAFPLLLANTLDWLTGTSARAGSQRLDQRPLDLAELDTRRTGHDGAATLAKTAVGARPPRLAEEPALALLLLTLAALVAEWTYRLVVRVRRTSGAARERWPWTTWLPRLGLLGVIVAALAGVTVRRPTGQLSVAVLVDLSESVDQAALARTAAPLRALEDRARRSQPEADLHPLVFARTPQLLLAGTALESLPRSGGDGPRPDRTATDLGGALAAGRAALQRDRVGRLLLLSDGASNQSVDQLAALVHPARVFTLPLSTTPTPAALIEDLSLRGPARRGAPFDLEAKVWAATPATVDLEVTVLSSPGSASRRQSRTLAAGHNQIKLPASLDEATAVYQLRMTPGATSPEFAAQSVLLPVASEGQPRVRIQGRAGACAPLERALAAEQMRVEAGAGPLPSSELLATVDLLVLCDLPLARLSGDEQRLLAAQVRERGLGLLVTGGAEGWGAGNYEGTALGALMPLENLPHTRKEEPTAALALVIDRSGSMSGPKIELAKEAARASAAMMNPLDLISVITFDSQASTVVRLQPAGNRQRILGDIGALRSGGGTNILAGLREAIAELQATDARRKHVILLSDGQSPSEGISDLVDEAAAAHITVSAVGVGDGADLPLLQLIASRGGGRFHRARDPATLPRIFSRETAQVTSAAEAPRGTRLRTLRATEALRGVPMESAPPLFGHARGRARPGAEVLLQSDRGQPVLARWNQGLGQVMVWASDFSPRWSGEWLRWRPHTQLWGQLARSLMVSGGAELLPLEAKAEGDEVRVLVRAFTTGDQPRRGLLATLNVHEVQSDGTLRPRSARSMEEGAPGEYLAWLPRGEAAALLLRAQLKAAPSAAGPGWRANGQLALWPPLERQRPTSPRTLMTDLARVTGGQVLTAGDLRPVLDPGDEQVQRAFPLRPWLLIAALVLFLADIARRRANFRALS